MRQRKAKSKKDKKDSPSPPSSPLLTLTDPTKIPPPPSGFRIIKSTKKTSKTNSSDDTTATPNSSVADPLESTIIKVTIPSNLTGSELRTFRKKSRRLAREKLGSAYTDSSVVFRNASSVGKRKFDSINDALKKAATDKVLEKETAKKQKREDSIKAKQQSAEASPEEQKNYVALDCEMVGVGSSGKKSVLARVSLTSYNGSTVLDTHVKVVEKVTDFRTHVSGIRPADLKNKSSIAAVTLRQAQEMVIDKIEGKIVVGHALKNDFKCLMIDHPKYMIRDTARFQPYMRKAGTGKFKPRKLRDLVKENFKDDTFQKGIHDSCKDADAAMRLYRLRRGEWEREVEVKARKGGKKRVSAGLKGGFKNVERGERGEREEKEGVEEEVEEEGESASDSNSDSGEE